MIIECPSCTARFAVPDQAIGASGRRVRCSKCQHMWQVRPEHSAKADTEAADKAEAAPPAQQTLSKRAKISYTALYAGLIAAVIVLLLLLFMPKAAGFPPSEGLAFERLTLEQTPTMGGERFASHPFYMIEGAVRNTGDTPTPMPVLRVTYRDAGGSAIYTRSYDANDKMIAPGESVTFMLEKLERPDTSGGVFMVQMGSRLELALRGAPAHGEE